MIQYLFSAASLALLDAGVPISSPVGGIAIGMFRSEEEASQENSIKHVILTDLVRKVFCGIED